MIQGAADKPVKPYCKAVLIFVVAVGFSKPVLAKEMCASLPEPQFLFHGMAIENFGSFSRKRLGIGLTYASGEERLSIFKFDDGLARIDDETLKKFTVTAIRDIFRVVKFKGEKIEKSIVVPKVTFTGFPLRSYLLLASKNGKLFFEFLGMGSDGKCMTKVRYTYSKDADAGSALKRYGEYLQSLERYVSEKPGKILEG